MTLQEKILEALRDASDYDKLAMWNDYAQEYCPDDYIYTVADLDYDELFTSAKDAVMAVLNGNFSTSDWLCRFDGYGNLQSFNEVDDIESPYYDEELADYLAETGEYYAYLDIEDDEEEGE